MEKKIFVNSAIATSEWRKAVGKVLCFLLLGSLALTAIPLGILWFISLGHINLLGIWLSTIDMIEANMEKEVENDHQEKTKV